MSQELFPFFDPEAGNGGAMRLVLTVWTRGGWHACAEWGDGERRSFDSPFELARFIAAPPRPPLPDPLRGLR
jgi:hypothetical protein